MPAALAVSLCTPVRHSVQELCLDAACWKNAIDAAVPVAIPLLRWMYRLAMGHVDWTFAQCIVVGMSPGFEKWEAWDHPASESA